MSSSKTGIIYLTVDKIKIIDRLATKIGIQYFLRLLAIFLINCYQKYISPYKGFSCAYRRLYGSESCSAYVKKAIANYNLTKAISLFQKRLANCKAASMILHSSNSNRAKKRQYRHRNNNDCEQYCDCLSWLELPFEILSCDLLNGDCADCNDCGACDFGGCDF